MISYGRQHIDQNDINYVTKILKSRLITQGPEVLKFEKPDSRKEGERFEGEETETVPMAIQKLVSEAKLAV